MPSSVRTQGHNITPDARSQVYGRLLVVDDEESVAVSVSEVLRHEGHSVETALSGEEAIELLKTLEFDLVLTDLHMEGIDGISVLAEIGRRAPLTVSIVLTGFASLESAIAAMRHGAYDYLIKPCHIEDMKQTIRRGLEHRRLVLAERDARLDLEKLNRELEQRVTERTSDLQRAIQDLHNANRGKDIFFAMVSHELRTPLTPILGWSKILRSRIASARLSDEDLNKGLDTIDRNARLQARLIDDLLDMSRIVSGKLELDREPTDLCVAVEAALETMREQASSQGIKLEVEYRHAPLIVEGAPLRLRQIVWNLLSNAIKFTETGGQVAVHTYKSDNEACVMVVDTGKGLEPESVGRIFEFFHQADDIIERREKGLGLGLPIVRTLVELHGGWVSAESEGIGRGSRFTFGIPFGSSVSLVQEEKLTTSDLKLSRPVLVVEDSEDTLEMLHTLFEQAGCQVLQTDSAREALQVAASVTPGLIISDIGMPDIDGYELIARIRELPGLENVPAIALSGHTTRENAARAISSGFSAHIAKPVDLEELLRLAQKLIADAV